MGRAVTSNVKWRLYYFFFFLLVSLLWGVVMQPAALQAQVGWDCKIWRLPPASLAANKRKATKHAKNTHQANNNPKTQKATTKRLQVFTCWYHLRFNQWKAYAPLLFCWTMRIAKQLTFFVEASLSLLGRNKNFGGTLHGQSKAEIAKWPKHGNVRQRLEIVFFHLIEEGGLIMKSRSD